MPEHGFQPDIERVRKAISEERALRDEWFGPEKFQEHFGPIRPDRLSEESFVSAVREVLAQEIELMITQPGSASPEQAFDFPAMLRNNERIPSAPWVKDKVARIASDLRLKSEEYEQLVGLLLLPEQTPY